MKPLLKASVMTLLLALLNAGASYAEDFEAPADAVNTYIKAVKTGSGNHIDLAFSESASIQYFGRDGEYNAYSRDAFSKLVNTGNKWDAKIEITQMKITGSAANATVEFTWGDSNEHGYVDYLNLINDGNGWQITDKVAQYVER